MATDGMLCTRSFSVFKHMLQDRALDRFFAEVMLFPPLDSRSRFLPCLLPLAGSVLPRSFRVGTDDTSESASLYPPSCAAASPLQAPWPELLLDDFVRLRFPGRRRSQPRGSAGETSISDAEACAQSGTSAIIRSGETLSLHAQAKPSDAHYEKQTESTHLGLTRSPNPHVCCCNKQDA